jgi:hypothetical protein
MSKAPQGDPSLQQLAGQIPSTDPGLGGFNAREDSYSEKVVDAIEMIGEEEAAGMKPAGSPDVTPGMRFLHSSRTIHQLVTDRNRAVGIFLAVASLLLTATGAIYHAQPRGDLIIPIGQIQKWCLPITFGVLTIIAVFMNFLLIRTRVGLIYEVAKMNALLGLPIGRVKRNSPLSIHFILQALISLMGGASAGLFATFMFYLADPNASLIGLWASLIGGGVALGLMLLYLATVNHITSDRRLQGLPK